MVLRYYQAFLAPILLDIVPVRVPRRGPRHDGEPRAVGRDDGPPVARRLAAPRRGAAPRHGRRRGRRSCSSSPSASCPRRRPSPTGCAISSRARRPRGRRHRRLGARRARALLRVGRLRPGDAARGRPHDAADRPGHLAPRGAHGHGARDGRPRARSSRARAAGCARSPGPSAMAARRDDDFLLDAPEAAAAFVAGPSDIKRDEVLRAAPLHRGAAARGRRHGRRSRRASTRRRRPRRRRSS